MFILVQGRNKSGKSVYAEGLTARLAQQAGGELVYLATMIPNGDGEEGAGCVARHRAQRAGYGFTTVEQPFRAADAHLPGDATVLLEDVSNLLANDLFAEGGTGGAADIVADVLALAARCQNLIAVSISGLEPGLEFDEPTNGYIRGLNAANEKLFEAADVVVEMRQREPHLLKGVLD